MKISKSEAGSRVYGRYHHLLQTPADRYQIFPTEDEFLVNSKTTRTGYEKTEQRAYPYSARHFGVSKKYEKILSKYSPEIFGRSGERKMKESYRHLL